MSPNQNPPDCPNPANTEDSRIREAIRAKRERQHRSVDDIAALEAALIADIENFDLGRAEQQARCEQQGASGAGMSDPAVVFPDIVPLAEPRLPGHAPGARAPVASLSPAAAVGGSRLLDRLRQQAEQRQFEQHVEMSERELNSEAIDRGLKRLFHFLHDLVQQINVLKPEIPRNYLLSDQLALGRLTWQEGFTDYRAQNHSAGALVELTTFSAQLVGKRNLHAEREGPLIERFRNQLIDCGLAFDCKEFRNARGYVERAAFEIRSQVSLSVRFRADFAQGRIVVEMRNVERLGSTQANLLPQAIDDDLCDELGNLILAQPNRFRELARRG